MKQGVVLLRRGGATVAAAVAAVAAVAVAAAEVAATAEVVATGMRASPSASAARAPWEC